MELVSQQSPIIPLRLCLVYSDFYNIPIYDVG